MPFVIRDLPYFGKPNRILFPDGYSQEANANQIILWVSLTPVGCIEFPPNTRRFPTILDTGNTDNFAIGPAQLRDWSGLYWRDLPLEARAVKYLGVTIPLRKALLWIHPNQHGWRDWIDPVRPPVSIPLLDGIAVYGDGERVGLDSNTAKLPAPRLPLLGLRALTENHCQLHIDGARRMVSLCLPV